MPCTSERTILLHEMITSRKLGLTRGVVTVLAAQMDMWTSLQTISKHPSTLTCLIVLYRVFGKVTYTIRSSMSFLLRPCSLRNDPYWTLLLGHANSIEVVVHRLEGLLGSTLRQDEASAILMVKCSLLMNVPLKIHR